MHAAWTVGSGEVVLYGLMLFALLTGWPIVRQEEVDLERHSISQTGSSSCPRMSPFVVGSLFFKWRETFFFNAFSC